jgi:2-polyprenyl-6-methoxyphenol hydroxylase-like FAD-dependent oxidoreductase
MQALARMRSPIMAEMTRLMEPISPVYANRAMRNRWRHYETWNERLDGFIAIGDAFCHYNPVYAQGMTALALSATMLRACLEAHPPDSPQFAREFFDAQARIQRDPWRLSAGVDLRFPFTIGDRPFSMKAFNVYLDGVGLAAKDPRVRRCLVEVAQLIRPLSDLFAPGIAGRVGVAALAEAVGAIRRLLLRPHPATIPPMPPPFQIPADERSSRPAVA